MTLENKISVKHSTEIPTVKVLIKGGMIVNTEILSKVVFSQPSTYVTRLLTALTA